MAKNLQKEYYEKRKCCPKCFSTKFFQTDMGYVINSEKSKDENDCSCFCGWKGIVHDLVEKKK